MQTERYTVVAMDRASRLTPASARQGSESLGERLARLRKERGYTQKELGEKTGLIQALISDYERGKLRLNADTILRLATALEVTTDDLLQPAGSAKPAKKPNRRVLRRLERIEALPLHVQTNVLRSLDLMLKGVSPLSRQENGR